MELWLKVLTGGDLLLQCNKSVKVEAWMNQLTLNKLQSSFGEHPFNLITLVIWKKHIKK